MGFAPVQREGEVVDVLLRADRRLAQQQDLDPVAAVRLRQLQRRQLEVEPVGDDQVGLRDVAGDGGRRLEGVRVRALRDDSGDRHAVAANVLDDVPQGRDRGHYTDGVALARTVVVAPAGGHHGAEQGERQGEDREAGQHSCVHRRASYCRRVAVAINCKKER